jgi:hypothetical protein
MTTHEVGCDVINRADAKLPLLFQLLGLRILTVDFDDVVRYYQQNAPLSDVGRQPLEEV